MVDITIEEITYGGNDLTNDVEGALDYGTDVSNLRLEVYVNGNDVREPYLITLWPGNLTDSLSIGKTWYYDDKIEFQLWAAPKETFSHPDVDFDDAYDSYQTKLGSYEVSDATEAEIPLGLGGDVSLKTSTDTSPSDQYQEVETPSGGTQEELTRTAAVESVISNFQAEDDEGLEAADKADVVSVIDGLTRRVDVDGLNDSPDGYPDDLLRTAGQDHHGHCASTAVLVNYGLHYPRRLAEFCRSVYQPMIGLGSETTDTGFLVRSATHSEHKLFVGNFLRTQTQFKGRNAEQAFMDLLVFLIRRSIRNVRKIYRDVPDDQHNEPGLNVDETAALKYEHYEVDDRHVTFKSAGLTGAEVLKYGKRALDRDNPVSLALDSALFQKPNNLPQDASNNHAMALLDTNVDSVSSGPQVPNQVEITLHNSWEQAPTGIRLAKSTADKYLFGISEGIE